MSLALFNIWFPAIVGALFIGLLVACLWDILRRKLWVFASRFWPGVLEYVGLQQPRSNTEGRPNFIVLEVEHLENSTVVWRLRPDLVSTVQSRNSGLENGANPFEQPGTRALAPPGEEEHRPLLQAGVNQAAQSDDITDSTDQLVHHPRPSEGEVSLRPLSDVDQVSLSTSDNKSNSSDQIISASSGGARTSLEESITVRRRPTFKLSNYYGVRCGPDHNKWGAEIRVAKCSKKVWLGTFDTDVAAARGVDLARKLVKCGKKLKFNLPCPELDAYSVEIPSHLDLTNIANERSMFEEVVSFIRKEAHAYVASFEEAQRVKSGPSTWKVESAVDNLLSIYCGLNLQIKGLTTRQAARRGFQAMVAPRARADGGPVLKWPVP